MGEGGGYGRGGSSITSAPKPSSLAPPGDQSPARLGMVAASRAPVWGEAGSRWSHLKLGPRDQALSPARLFKAAAQNRRGGGAQGPGSGRWEKVSGGSLPQLRESRWWGLAGRPWGQRQGRGWQPGQVGTWPPPYTSVLISLPLGLEGRRDHDEARGRKDSQPGTR